MYKLREEKKECRQYLINLHKELREIHKEIPKESKKYGPRVPDVPPDAYPEQNLIINVPFPEYPESLISVKNLSLREFVYVGYLVRYKKHYLFPLISSLNH